LEEMRELDKEADEVLESIANLIVWTLIKKSWTLISRIIGLHD
jgi:hypothetical protein